jgi:nitrogen fixation protein NifB
MCSPSVVMRRHPCFDEQAHERVGRVHLPVAPRCNIRCAFCERRVCASVTRQHPGWAREVLSPPEALALVRRIALGSGRGDTACAPCAGGDGRGDPAPTSCVTGGFVVGVAGPGEPLANEATFEALRLVHGAFPGLVKCVSTNGLLLEDSLPRLLAAGVRALTVTVNAPDAEVGQRIYVWVRHRGTVYRGREGAEVLLASQLRGIRAALAAGLAVKVNTVLIPGVNDEHLPGLARRLAALDVRLMNIMPLIPGGQMRDRRPPTCDELRQARLACEGWLPQFRRCQQCRADVIRLPARRGAAGAPEQGRGSVIGAARGRRGGVTPPGAGGLREPSEAALGDCGAVGAG